MHNEDMTIRNRLEQASQKDAMGYTKGEWKAENREEDGTWYIGLDNLPKDVYPLIINMPTPFSVLGRCGAIVTAGAISEEEAKAISKGYCGICKKPFTTINVQYLKDLCNALGGDKNKLANVSKQSFCPHCAARFFRK